MRVGGLHSVFAKSGSTTSSSHSERVHNASGLNGLGNAAANPAGDWDDTQPDIAGTGLSRNGTTEFAPLWNGPALRPTFVAQVMGQVMMDHREQALSLTRLAYSNNGTAAQGGAIIDGRL